MKASRALPTLDPEKWVDTHGDYLFSFAKARVRSTEVAEELVQDTLLAALTARHRFRGGCSERSWLTAILKRKTVDWLRQKLRQKKRKDATLENTVDEWTDKLFTRNGKWRVKVSEWSTMDPSHSLTCEEFRMALLACLDRLPSRLRAAFVLRHMEEKSTESVCDEIGMTPTHFWVALHRARLRLWKCLNVSWFGERSKEEQS